MKTLSPHFTVLPSFTVNHTSSWGEDSPFIMSRMGITNYHSVRDIDAGIQKAILACTTMSFCVGECMACRPEDMVSRSK